MSSYFSNMSHCFPELLFSFSEVPSFYLVFVSFSRLLFFQLIVPSHSAQSCLERYHLSCCCFVSSWNSLFPLGTLKPLHRVQFFMDFIQIFIVFDPPLFFYKCPIDVAISFVMLYLCSKFLPNISFGCRSFIRAWKLGRSTTKFRT